ncbi:unnamed protein product [Heligmosomoides polygyrus]|uniref:3-deoxy-7-phosphoheptulonate synthase n=1 Tax=Heligmosomoides polygyrus TaxID=6339 RepID=A0A183GPH8_HELPZ|nr:unnamed protein product [Heligmosomoides polygyrus]
MCDISSPVPSGAIAMDDKKMLYRPALLLQSRFGRSTNEVHRLLQERKKGARPLSIDVLPSIGTQTLQILLGPRYTIFFGLLTKSRSCLKSCHML